MDIKKLNSLVLRSEAFTNDGLHGVKEGRLHIGINATVLSIDNNIVDEVVVELVSLSHISDADLNVELGVVVDLVVLVTENSLGSNRRVTLNHVNVDVEGLNEVGSVGVVDDGGKRTSDGVSDLNVGATRILLLDEKNEVDIKPRSVDQLSLSVVGVVHQNGLVVLGLAVVGDGTVEGVGLGVLDLVVGVVPDDGGLEFDIGESDRGGGLLGSDVGEIDLFVGVRKAVVLKGLEVRVREGEVVLAPVGGVDEGELLVDLLNEVLNEVAHADELEGHISAVLVGGVNDDGEGVGVVDGVVVDAADVDVSHRNVGDLADGVLELLLEPSGGRSGVVVLEVGGDDVKVDVDVAVATRRLVVESAEDALVAGVDVLDLLGSHVERVVDAVDFLSLSLGDALLDVGGVGLRDGHVGREVEVGALGDDVDVVAVAGGDALEGLGGGEVEVVGAVLVGLKDLLNTVDGAGEGTDSALDGDVAVLNAVDVVAVGAGGRLKVELDQLGGRAVGGGVAIGDDRGDGDDDVGGKTVGSVVVVVELEGAGALETVLVARNGVDSALGVGLVEVAGVGVVLDVSAGIGGLAVGLEVSLGANDLGEEVAVVDGALIEDVEVGDAKGEENVVVAIVVGVDIGLRMFVAGVGTVVGEDGVVLTLNGLDDILSRNGGLAVVGVASEDLNAHKSRVNGGDMLTSKVGVGDILKRVDSAPTATDIISCRASVTKDDLVLGVVEADEDLVVGVVELRGENSGTVEGIDDVVVVAVLLEDIEALGIAIFGGVLLEDDDLLVIVTDSGTKCDLDNVLSKVSALGTVGGVVERSVREITNDVAGEVAVAEGGDGKVGTGLPIDVLLDTSLEGGQVKLIVARGKALDELVDEGGLFIFNRSVLASPVASNLRTVTVHLSTIYRGNVVTLVFILIEVGSGEDSGDLIVRASNGLDEELGSGLLSLALLVGDSNGDARLKIRKRVQEEVVISDIVEGILVEVKANINIILNGRAELIERISRNIGSLGENFRFDKDSRSEVTDTIIQRSVDDRDGLSIQRHSVKRQVSGDNTVRIEPEISSASSTNTLDSNIEWFSLVSHSGEVDTNVLDTIYISEVVRGTIVDTSIFPKAKIKVCIVISDVGIGEEGILCNDIFETERRIGKSLLIIVNQTVLRTIKVEKVQSDTSTTAVGGNRVTGDGNSVMNASFMTI